MMLTVFYKQKCKPHGMTRKNVFIGKAGAGMVEVVTMVESVGSTICTCGKAPGPGALPCVLSLGVVPPPSAPLCMV